MRLVKWTPKRNLVSLPAELDNFFNNFGMDMWNTDSVWTPSVDISESDDSYEVNAEIPGMKKEDIKISFEDDMLLLSGERKHEEEEKGKNFHRIERVYGKFERSFHLPKNIKTDAIKANYKNGILTVNIPKSEEAKPKEISIN